MDRGEIREAVRDDIGEPREGFWKDAEINRWIQRASNRHAREALSVERTRLSSSVQGVQEYGFPPNFGQLIGARFKLEGSDRKRRLVYIPKSRIAEWGFQDTFPGTPRFYYVYDKGIGLFPVPNTPPLLEHTFSSDECANFVQRLDTGPPNSVYQTAITLRLRPPTGDEDTLCTAYVSYLSLYLRRYGFPYQGELQLAFFRGGNHTFRYDSSVIYAENVSSVPGWYHFDFSNNPIEVNSTEQTYGLVLYADSDYLSHLSGAPGEVGIQVGAEPNDDVAYFQLHEFRNDIETDFWANTCRKMTLDTDVPEVREDYHDTLIHMTDSYAMKKGGRFLRLAQEHEAIAQGEINQARTHQLQKTQGEKVNPDSIGDYDTTYLDYNDTTETFTLNFA